MTGDQLKLLLPAPSRQLLLSSSRILSGHWSLATKDPDRPCWRIRFGRSVVILIYKRPFRSIMFIQYVSNAPPHIMFSPTSGLENKEPSAKEGFLIFWLPVIHQVKISSLPQVNVIY